MSTARREATDPVAVSLLSDLDRLTERARAAAEEVSRLMSHRNDLFVQLKALGVTHREIAAHSDLTEMAVKKAIDKTTRG